jgi:hypothetical protein
MSGQFGTCTSCGAQILFVETEKGRMNPLDPQPNPSGNVVIVKRISDGHEIAKTLGPWSGEEYHALPHYTSHFATCPHAADHRRRRD